MTEWHPLRSKSSQVTFTTLDREAEKRAKACDSASMPKLDHLTSKDYYEVYEPSDDTYLLIDALLYDAQHSGLIPVGTQDCTDTSSHSSNSSNDCVTVELGCGTGVPTIYLASLWAEHAEKSATRSRPPLHVVTDINPAALRVATQTAKVNGIDSFEAVQCDLASSLLPRFEGNADVVLFNPPYVPTPDDEVGSNGIEASWAGGQHGRRVVDRAIPQIAQLLRRPTGVGYLITVDDNIPEELAALFQEHGLSMVPLMRRKASNEYLSVQKISWTEATTKQV
mmetsp:Transcript_23131/g.35678  ORF Transcript_23131/g.35678 Transcript_23131/m.35678 type:complete len:281 (+) Transcript_23131:74-916(+)|eukprot:CAMPEP_0195307818 /NCGR_PEP_ID=MMETSP0707-20130614/37908_1 /TAXON_ID=33640 /ORGANISM="Asterionellopsis glacialis, Strain CCMP134" /LENGTH=280 /DNA_ID=CAMNT_0040372071 /DNA_START=67 /DNA_END=909 /DNA_ORIENTATION=+